ncbi:hypothetical protein MNBD_NITROSPIRAE01-1278 [hydrothermal vent metagenome]|uniref:Outer membrane protein beta-barrel domain-containing protein n=1 Tax=hydrothermal vent metagenome TaxID=652676 RepID=A0A3B1DBM7_9ZZZZ
MKFILLAITGFFSFFVALSSPAAAAPIGVPGATVGTNQSTLGLELNFMLDRDFEGPGDTESMSVLAKGQVGMSERVDFLYRAGFGRFEVGGRDSDAGPAFGFGTKVTWATLDDMNLKIGSVAQMLQVRADGDSGGRNSFTEYDFALGAYIDAGGAAAPEGRSVLTTYGGFVFSSLEIVTSGGGVALEDSSFGAFAGLLMKVNQKTEVGAELRLLDQTALSFYVAFAF